MLTIAHRGNLRGSDTRENRPDWIKTALDAGFYVEVDVWLKDRTIWLGHDGLHYLLPEGLTQHPKLVYHAKDGATLQALIVQGVHVFANEADPYAITSRGYVWTNYGVEPLKDSIVMLQDDDPIPPDVAGICTDNLALRS